MFRLLPALLALLLAGSAVAQSNPTPPRFVPAIVFDIGGKHDKGFNEAGLQGAERYRRATGTAYREYELTLESDREAVLRQLVEEGATLIVSMGYAQVPAVTAAAKAFPNVRFAIVDGVVEAPNVRSFRFKEEEGSFLAGLLAAMASRTGTIGFIGGMDIPVIRAFGCGYAQGARHAVPEIRVLEDMAGTTPAAWLDPERGKALAGRQMDAGADVIFAAAGATGFGVLQATTGRHRLGIGVDSNQNHLHPGAVLTSMVKRVDVAVYNAFMDAKNDAFTAGFNNLGLAEGGVDYAMDDNNKDLVTAEMKAAADKAKADIIAGTIQVHDYMSDNACPY